MIVRELITKLGFSTNTAQLNKAEKATEQLKDRANQASMAFRNIAASLVSLAAIKQVIAIGDEMQSLRARIGMLPQTIGDAGEAFDQVAERASNAKQSVDAYSSFYIKAGNATQDFIKDQDQLLRVVDGAAFGLAASGAGAVEQAQAFFQLGQAIGSPTVQMAEMNTLIDAAPDLFRELGKVIPGAKGELKEFIGTGAVTGKMLAEGLEKVAEIFEKKMRKMPMNVGTAMVLLNNRWVMIVDRMNRKSMFITKIADAILLSFDKTVIAIKWLVESLGGFENAIRMVGIAIGVAFGAGALSWLYGFKIASLKAMAPFLLWAVAILAVILLLDDLYVWIKGGKSVTGDLIGPWTEWKDTVETVWNFIKAMFVTLGNLIGAYAAFWYGVLTFDPDLISASLGGVGNMLWAAAKEWAQIIIGAFKSAWDWAANKSAEFRSMLVSIAKGLRDSIYNAIVGGASAALNAIKGKIEGGYNSIKDFVGFGDESSPISAVTPSSMAPSSMGMGGANIQSNTTVNLSVPPGTTAEQANFLQSAAEKSFSRMSDNNLARDLSVYAP